MTRRTAEPAPGRTSPAPALLALLAAACAGTSTDRSGQGRSWLEAEDRAAAARRGEATSATFSPEKRAFMEEGLRQFSRADARWETTRKAWMELGPRETEFLVQTMWAGLLRMQQMSQPNEVERARHELVLIGAPSVPLMTAVLREGEMASRAEGEEAAPAVDDMQRREASSVLSLIGPPAVPSLLDVCDRARTKSGKRFAIQALGNMGDRAGSSAAVMLARQSASGDDLLAVEAVLGMANYRDPHTRQALVDALRSPEPLVREKAAHSLGARGDIEAIGPMTAAASSARAAGRIGEAQKIERAIQAIESAGTRPRR